MIVHLNEDELRAISAWLAADTPKKLAVEKDLQYVLFRLTNKPQPRVLQIKDRLGSPCNSPQDPPAP